MSLTKTTLSADVAADALVVSVAAATGAVVGQPLKIDNEFIRQVQEINGLAITVLGRGAFGTAAVAHGATAPVTFAAVANDFVQPVSPLDPQTMPDLVFLDGDGAIPVPTRDTRYVITKTSAAALTLAAPSAGSDGVVLEFIGATDYAHVITSAAAFTDGTSGGNTILTSAAYAGSSVKLMALKGAYVLVAGATNSGPWVAS